MRKHLRIKWFFALAVMGIMAFPSLAEANPTDVSETVSTQQKNVEVVIVVTDSQDQPLIGATAVSVENPSKAGVVGVDGKVTLSVPANSSVTIQMMGYQTQTVEIGGRSTFGVVLEDEAIAVDEVVVVGYGMQKKVNMTGSITNVKTDELTTIATTNLSNTLAGRAPGVNITNSSGLSGSSSEIRMRGGVGDPLFVIDGIIRDKDAFDALEANEVEQMSFLKDAATASIYGSQAGNGVVLVVTKSGTKSSKPIFNYQGSYTFSNTTKELFSDMWTATDELIYQNRVAEYLGNDLPNGDTEFAYFENRNYNVNDYIWQNPWNTKHSMSVTGGNDKVQYYALASYIGEEGSYITVNNEKFNIRSNVTAQLTDRIKMNFNVAGSQQDAKRFYWLYDDDDSESVGDLYRCTFNWPKVYPFYLYEDGTPAEEITDYPVQTPMGSWQAWSVIDQVVGDRYLKTTEREMSAILSFDVDLDFITKGLTTKVSGSYVGKDWLRKTYLTFQHNYVWVSADPDGNRFLPSAPDPNNMNTFTWSQASEFLQYQTENIWSEQFNWFLNYNRTFGTKHDVSATVVFEQRQNGGTYTLAKMSDPLTNYDQEFVYSTDSENRYGTASEETDGALSWIGRFNYSYDSKYIAEFSFRYDGNSLFPEDKRWGFFPSASLAWRVIDEDFMTNSRNWLSNFKVRASVGTTGNDLNVSDASISPFSYMATYETGTNYMFGDTYYSGITSSGLPSTYLTWATSTTYNAGIDLGFLNNRLTVEMDAFYRKEVDILGTRIATIPNTYGQSLAPENYAERSWRGFEVNTAYRGSRNGFNYTVYANIGYSKGQWDVLDEDALYSAGGNLEDLGLVGSGTLNNITGYKTVGMVTNQAQLDQLLAEGFTQFGRDPYLGCLLFEDVNSDGYVAGADGKVTTADIQLLSNKADPRFNYGFGTNLNWKNLSLDLHFQGVGGYDRMMTSKDLNGFCQYGGTIRPYFPIWTSDEVWTPENTDGTYPRVVGSSWYESGYGYQSYWIRNGAYLRLKNLNIGYNLPQQWLKPYGIENVQVFMNATNLFSISAVNEFMDPEQAYYDSYPIMKSFTFGIDIKF